MKKIVISGTGRCGTTFLMILFTLLGYHTGYDKDTYKTHIFKNCNSGLENISMDTMESQYDVVKQPELTDHPDILKKFMEKNDILYMIIPIREYTDAAKSRANLGGVNGGDGSIPGGLWKANNEIEQASFYHYKTANYLVSMVTYDIPTIFLDFIRMTRDPHYLFETLRPVLSSIQWDAFHSAYMEADSHQKRGGPTPRTG